MMTRAKAQRTQNSKQEIRNSKQFQMTKNIQNSTPASLDSMFWIFPGGDLFVCFGFRYSDLEFALRLERFGRLEQLERF
jgi:hypothetical protein